MKFLKFFVFLSALLWLSAANAADLTKKEVRAAVTEMYRAVDNQDFNKLAEYFHENIVFDFSVEENGEIIKTKMKLDNYVSYINEAFSRIDSYEYKEDKLSIKIKSPNKAQVTSQLSEKTTIGNLQVPSVTNARFTFERIDGILLITAYSSHSRL